MFNSLKKFLSYWFFRYLLVTELYMVEKWERVMIHIVFFIIFALISVFNTKIVVAGVSSLKNSMFPAAQYGLLMEEPKHLEF